MTPAEFKLALQDAMPSVEELEEHGLEADEIEDMQQTFRILENPGSANTRADKLCSLLGEYDWSGVQIGQIVFRKAAERIVDGYVFADFELDRLIVRDDGTIVMQRSGDQQVSLCAVDPQRFLDSLAKYVAIRRQKHRWKGLAVEAARQCAELAGGTSCYDFHAMQCGFLN